MPETAEPKTRLEDGQKLGTLYRYAQFDRASINEEERTVELSISSDEPYGRWFGTEILKHDASCIEMERMKAGAPLLFNHDRNAHLGRIVSCETDGKKLRIKAKFSNSKFAQEKWQDVKDGILLESSVGYIVHKFEVDEDEETYTATKWEPLEGSLVTIPADFTVGVGRGNETDGSTVRIFAKEKVDGSQKCEQTRAMPETAAPETKTAPNVQVVDEREAQKRLDDALNAEMSRQAEIRAIAKQFDVDEKTTESFMADRTKTTDAFRKTVMDLIAERQSDPTRADVGMSKKEVREFSLSRAIAQIAVDGRLSGLERASCDAAAKSVGRSPSGTGFIIPEEVNRFQAMCLLSRAFFERAQTASTFSAGGATVEQQMSSLIELLRNQSVLGRLGITIMTGLQGDVIFPVQLTAATAYDLSEVASTTSSEVTFGQKTMTPHRVSASIPYSLQLLRQSSLSVDALIRSELDTVINLKRDLNGLHGTGAGGQTLGVQNTTGINATVTYGGAATWADVVQHETGIAVDNADIGSMKFALSAAAVGKWKTILKDSVAGAGYLIADDMTANGYPVERTNQISGDVSFFGVWSQLMLGIWAGREVIVNPYAGDLEGTVRVTMHEFYDYLVRQPLAFNVSTDSAAQ